MRSRLGKALGAIVLVFIPFPVTAAPILPVKSFATLPVLKKPLLSPDGRQVAARSIKDGRSTIVLIDADRPTTPPRTIALGEIEIAGLRWAGNKRMLVTVLANDDVAGGYRIPFLRLIAVDIDTGDSRILDRGSSGRFAGDVLYVSPWGDWALVASQNDLYSYPSVKRVDLVTGKAQQIEKPRDGVWDWYADEDGVVRAGVAQTDKRWTVWYRDHEGEKLRRMRGKIDKDDQGVVDRFIFRGKGSWVVTNERTGRFALYEYDLANGTLGRAIYEHPAADIDDVLYEASDGDIRAISIEVDRRRIVWMDAEDKALQEKLDKALKSTTNLPVQWSKDNRRVLVWSEGASDPGRYYLLDRTTARMHAVVDPYPGIDPADLAEVRWVSYVARDGLPLNAYLTVPKGRDPKALPLILMPHGGPFERDHWEYDAWVQFLANRGYAVLQPQFRGSTGAGKQLVEKGYGQWGRKMQDDLDDAVDWLARQGTIDPKRVCIAGGSYGGYAAMWGAIRNPERYRCAISYAGVSDLPRQLRENRKAFSATRYFKEWRKKVEGAEETDLRGVSPITYAGQLKVPLLIGHGEDDSTVSVNQSKAMAEALEKSGRKAITVYYPDEGHGWSNEENFADWLKRIEAFLKTHNPA